MTADGIVLRETLVSVAINLVLSILFFLLVFGPERPVRLATLGPDFLPQAFMVALMGTLVPSLLLRRTMGGPALPIVRRCLAIAAVAAAVAGGGAFAACAVLGGATLAAEAALFLKAMFGGVLAAVVTPIAIGRLLHSVRRPQ